MKVQEKQGVVDLNYPVRASSELTVVKPKAAAADFFGRSTFRPQLLHRALSGQISVERASGGPHSAAEIEEVLLQSA